MNSAPSQSLPQASPKTCGLAIWSLVLGILSLGCFYLLTAVPGVICGHVALSRIKRSAGTLTGGGLAIAGLVTGYIGIALSLLVVPMLMAIAIPNFVKARSVAQRNVCINNLRQIETAIGIWARENKKTANDQPTREELVPYLGGNRFPACPAGGTYTLKTVDDPPTCSIH